MAPGSAAPIDTSSQEWMLVCLARHICRLPDKAERTEMLDALRTKHSQEFVSQLEKLVGEQWPLVRLAVGICQLSTKPERHARLAALRAAHPEDFVMEVEKQVTTEWALMHRLYTQGKATNVDA